MKQPTKLALLRFAQRELRRTLPAKIKQEVAQLMLNFELEVLAAVDAQPTLTYPAISKQFGLTKGQLVRIVAKHSHQRLRGAGSAAYKANH